MKNNLLPLGSIVRLAGGAKNLMIIGKYIKTSDKEHDYISVPFPEGYINDKMFYLFDHKDIENVINEGFVNGEVKAYDNFMNKAVNEDFDNKKGFNYV